MNAFEFLLLLAVAAVCGAIGQALVGYSRGGCLYAIAAGFVGALLGTWLARLMRLPELFVLQIDTVAFPVVWSIVGAAVFVGIGSLLHRPAPRRRVRP